MGKPVTIFWIRDVSKCKAGLTSCLPIETPDWVGQLSKMKTVQIVLLVNGIVTGPLVWGHQGQRVCVDGAEIGGSRTLESRWCCWEPMQNYFTDFHRCWSFCQVYFQITIIVNGWFSQVTFMGYFKQHLQAISKLKLIENILSSCLKLGLNSEE